MDVFHEADRWIAYRFIPGDPTGRCHDCHTSIISVIRAIVLGGAYFDDKSTGSSGSSGNKCGGSRVKKGGAQRRVRRARTYCKRNVTYSSDRAGSNFNPRAKKEIEDD